MATKKSSAKNAKSNKPATKAKKGNKKVETKKSELVDTSKPLEKEKISKEKISENMKDTDKSISLKSEGSDALAVKGTDALAVKGVDDLAVKGTDALAVKGVDDLAVKGVDDLAVKGVDALAVKGVDDLAVQNNAPTAVKVEATISKQKSKPMPRAGHTEINPFLPDIATVSEVISETHNIVTVRVVLDDKARMASFSHKAGQVGQLSIFGVGEATFVINSPPSCKDYLQFSVMKTGEVTKAIHKLSAGDKIGVRAPLGSSFPLEGWKGKDIFFVGGGIGMAPLRTIMLQVLEQKSDYGKVSLLYGARTPLDMAFSYELDDWMSRKDLDCTLTIDAPFSGWEHKVGLIPNILLEIAPDPAKCIAVLCGPPIMIKFTVQALKKLNFADDMIYTTLERRMKCGIGLCGRCNLGGKYICVDGPVYTWAELLELPPEL